eukprot:SAG31_NODE_2148_length_6333_cov_16.166667_5_plen_65_part_00
MNMMTNDSNNDSDHKAQPTKRKGLDSKSSKGAETCYPHRIESRNMQIEGQIGLSLELDAFIDCS